MPRVKQYKTTIGKNRKGQYPTAGEQAKLHSKRRKHMKKVADKSIAARFLRG